MTRRAELEAWRSANPDLYEGLRRTIASAEGTLKGDGRIGYGIMFGGKEFTDFSRHPDKVNRTPGYASAAAGAYQFMPGTWSGVKKAIGATGFTPEEQNIGMLHLARQRLLPMGGLAAITKAGGLTPEIVNALAPEWASLPTLAGKSFYGQPVKAYAEVVEQFNKGKGAAKGSGNAIPTSLPSLNTSTPNNAVALGGTSGPKVIVNFIGDPKNLRVDQEQAEEDRPLTAVERAQKMLANTVATILNTDYDAMLDPGNNQYS